MTDILPAPDAEPCEFLAPWSDQAQDQEAGHQVHGTHCTLVLNNQFFSGGEPQAVGCRGYWPPLRPGGRRLAVKIPRRRVSAYSACSGVLGDTSGSPRYEHVCVQDEQTKRKARMKYLKTYPRTFPVTCIPGFADVTPYMMTTEPSLRDLRWVYWGNITVTMSLIKISATGKYCPRGHTEDIPTKHRD